MKSEFEQKAANAAVAAVEARWHRQHEQDVREANLKRLRGWFFGLLLLVIVSLGGWVGWQYFNGKPLGEILQKPELPAVVSHMASGSEGEQYRRTYGETVRRIVAQPLRLLKEMPAQLRPQRAPDGTVYVALGCDAKRVLRVFRLTADGRGTLSAVELSPLVPDRTIAWADFRKTCPKPYLISVGEGVYLCGSKDLKDGRTIVSRIRSLMSLPAER